MPLLRDCLTHTCAYSLKRNPIWRIVGITFIVIIVFSIIIGLTVHFVGLSNMTPLEKADKLLKNILLFDGHNDFALNMREVVANDLTRFNFSKNLSEIHEWARQGFSQTDLVRLKAGAVKAQFWVARAECDSQYKDSVEITLEQIDVIKRLVANYSDHMKFATSAQEVKEAFIEGKIASLIGISGGHSMHSSLGILRMYYELGVRYLSLTQSRCSTPWADAAIVDSVIATRPKALNEGLSWFGEKVVEEMNRIGMIIDLSHASVSTMKAVLIHSKAPVIFSNSNSKELCFNQHNVPDEILKLVKQTDGVVMLNFYPTLLKSDGINATLDDVVAHLNYLKDKMSANNIGLGSDFDGINRTPEGLEDVSKYPNLFAALYETGTWTEHEMEKLAGKNILRVLEDVERVWVRDKLENAIPGQAWIRKSDLKKMNYTPVCTTSKLYDPYPALNPYEMGRYQ